MTHSIFLMTFNQHGRCIPDALNCIDKDYDIVIIGSQECCHSIQKSFFCSSKRIWKNSIEIKLKQFSDDYIHIHSKSLNAQVLSIFIKQGINLTCLQSKSLKLGKYGANKGVISTQFCIDHQPFHIVSCHLNSGEKVKNRLSQVKKLSKFIEAQANSDQEKIFILGDLNFRIELEEDKCNQLIEQGQIFDILQQDQIIKNNFVFYDIKEILFNPTYKISDGNFSQGRTPSYTDRIMVYDVLGSDKYKTCQCKSKGQKFDGKFVVDKYDSYKVQGSDHWPVYGVILMVNQPMEGQKIFTK
ncbi:Inositol polyphosphate 5-phosphatase [Spironucleus salmonicida]|uniref:Endonuclease/Exonuclease/phosphatase family protein n=1 Tax=Spironucleus salmonicida TaxID=348837 RepID=V6LB80_9EUKA|nr:Inositol polyphosphate 5-phosphatase [Spironucleus salmonicida]|eukprot:EST41690.1 Endonuclease/Exonuclease/phosphatase family protein [Spironucleus salmonicida]